jgi:NAD(P)-dependent dehydrogenase (short-subunit alcohol dehydrogenase family)
MSTAIITGGAIRIGQAMAFHLASQGYNIALLHNSSDPEEALEKICANKVKCKAYKCNLSDLVLVEKIIGLVMKDFPDVKLLINSASVFIQESIEKTSTETLADTMNINLMAPYLLMREYKKQINKGSIINILDERIMKNIPTFAAYSVSKSALAHLTQLAAVEWGEVVRVNAIAPGLILQPQGETDEYLKRNAKNIPVKNHGNVEDILMALDYLLTSPFVNGETLFVDGGESKSVRASQ